MKVKFSSHYFIVVIVLVFQAAAAFRHGVSACYWLLFFVGIWYLFKDRMKPQRDVELFTASILIYLMFVAFSYVNVDNMQGATKHTLRILIIALFPIFYHCFYRAELSNKYILVGSVLAGFSFMSVASYEVHQLGLSAAVGPYNQIMFGSMATISALGAFLWFVNVAEPRHKFMALGGLVAALYAAVLSTSRGAWLGLAVGMLTILLLEIPRFRKNHSVALVITGIVFGLVGVYLLTGDLLVKRLFRMAQEWQMYTEGIVEGNSLGHRILLWNAAIDMWLENPLIGVGIGDYQHELQKMPKYKESVIAVFGYAHNIYLEALATTGLLGASGLVIAYVACPFYLYWRNYRIAKTDSEIRIVATFGIAITIAFAIFGLTENWSAHSQLAMYYVVMQAACISAIALRKEQGSVAA